MKTALWGVAALILFVCALPMTIFYIMQEVAAVASHRFLKHIERLT